MKTQKNKKVQERNQRQRTVKKESKRLGSSVPFRRRKPIRDSKSYEEENKLNATKVRIVRRACNGPNNRQYPAAPAPDYTSRIARVPAPCPYTPDTHTPRDNNIPGADNQDNASYGGVEGAAGVHSHIHQHHSSSHTRADESCPRKGSGSHD